MESLTQAVRAELARRGSFADFAALMDPRFATPAPFQQRLMLEAQEFWSSKTSRIAIVSVPPRFTKTQIHSVLLPIFILGENPRAEVVLASHSQDLAERNSRTARDLVESERWPFPTKLARDSTAATRWHLNTGGSVRAVGVGSGLLGRGADALIIDDPIADGNSLAECETAWEWFQEIAAGRLNSGGKVWIVHQRLSANDLTAKVLESEMAPLVRHTNLTAITADGHPLWNHFSLDELELRRKMMGSRAFLAQYMGEVSDPNSGIFKIDWFDRTYASIPEHSPSPPIEPMSLYKGLWPNQTVNHKRTIRVMALDAASKTGLNNDWSVLCTLATDWVDYYVQNVRRERVEFADLVRMLLMEYHEQRPDAVYVEDAANGTPLIQELRRATALPIIAVTPRGTKISRFEAISWICEARKIVLPERAPWKDAFLNEMGAVPNSRYDDQADAFTIALNGLETRMAQIEHDRWDRRQLSRLGSFMVR